MSLGEKLVPGTDDKHFCKPTDVAIASTGEFFVADGYCNSRIMKFDKDGKLLSQFGKPDCNDFLLVDPLYKRLPILDTPI